METKKIIGIKIIDPGSPPDVDTDYPKEFRPQVIKYSQDKYGYNNVASLMTPGPFKNKNAWKSMCTIHGIDSIVANKISELIPEGNDGELIDDFYYEGGEFYEQGADLRMAINTPELVEVLEDAMKLSGRQRETGVHACGIVLSKHDLVGTIPLMTRQRDGMTVTQWNYAECESIGLMKMDYLGLDTLDLNQETIKSIKSTLGVDISTEEIINSPLNDKEVFKMFQDGDTFGIFQFSKDGVRQLLREAQPTTLEELAAITALYRPGPMGMGLHQDFAKRKQDESARIPVHRAFYGTRIEEILKGTLNSLVFQEQVIKIATDCAGFTSKEADKLRKAMGKKDAKILAMYETKFLDGLLEHGYNNIEANRTLWDGMRNFAKYAFNKAHSFSYALNSYQSAYLKAHYPVHFMAVLLSKKFKTEEFSSYYDEAHRLGIKLLPPNINTSKLEISPTDDLKNITYGLGYIKTISKDTVSNIIKERETNGKYKDITDLLVRNSEIKASMLKALAGAGCLDVFGKSRKQIVENADKLIKSAENIRNIDNRGSLFSLIGQSTAEIVSTKLDEEDWSRLDKAFLEAKLTGIYLTEDPTSIIKLRNGSTVPLQERFQSIIDKAAFTSTVNQYITFMETKGRKAPNGERYIQAIINNGNSQLNIKIKGDIIRGITLKNALKRTNGDLKEAVKMTGFSLDRIFERLDIDDIYTLSNLKLPLLDPPEKGSLYQATFKTNRYGGIFLENYRKVEYSKNDREWNNYEIKDRKITLALIEKMILDKDNEYIGSEPIDIRVYDGDDCIELCDINNHNILYDFSQYLIEKEN